MGAPHHFFEAWTNKNFALSRLGRYQESLQAIDKALSLKRDSPVAWNNKSWDLLNLGRFEEALAASEEALKLNPYDNPEAWENKGLALSKLGRRDEAIEWLCQAWRVRERLPDEGHLIANALTKLGQASEECE
jgi:tetratricopeptide (TPR) repeat protein